MFNLFKKKKSHIAQFFNHFDREKREAIVSVIFLVGIVDGVNEKQGFESQYLNFYARELQVDLTKIASIVKEKTIPNLIRSLLSCLDTEKAAITFIWRGMANVDYEANSQEITLLTSLEDKLNFNLDNWYSHAIEKEFDEITSFIFGVVFPRGHEDISEGSLVLNHLAEHEVDPEIACQLYITFVIGFEISLKWNKESLENQITTESLEFTVENVDILHKFLKGRALLRLQNALK